MIDLKSLREKVMSAEELHELFNLELDLTEYKTKQHTSFHQSQTQHEQTEIKGNLSMLTTLLEICRERQSEIKDVNAKLNYHFRMAAKTMLEKQTYDSIMLKAQLPRKEFKAEAHELKKNKLK